MVPDISGINKDFDYYVPEELIRDIHVGDRVRVVLHGRKVGGWVVALSEHGAPGFSDVAVDKLLPIIKRAGIGVVSELVPLALNVASTYAGTRRAVLRSASSPRLNITAGSPHFGHVKQSEHSLVAEFASVTGSNVVAEVPPLRSVLSIVSDLAQHGPVVVVCPTVRMAVIGAAALRRHGCKVALVPDDWASAMSGVDVVIGARTAVWAPCPNMHAIVVVDEHDDSLQEERVPTWHAREVAIQRATLLNARCVLASPIPSPEALFHVSHGDANMFRASVAPEADVIGWPRIDIVDLHDVQVHKSLVSSDLLSRLRDPDASVLCILNTKGRAKLLACRNCRELAKCPTCDSGLQLTKDNVLHCAVCGADQDMLCSHCGRTAFLTVRQGISQLRDELEKASARPITEVEASTTVYDIADAKGVFIGTEALLHRVPDAHDVVFLDFDAEMMIPRVTAARDALALVIRAARVVGKNGRILIQTRHVHHPLIHALSQVGTDPAAFANWVHHDMQLRQSLDLPPFQHLARVSAPDMDALESLLQHLNIEYGKEMSGSLLMKAAQLSELGVLASQLRDNSVQRLRIEISPSRY